MRLPWECHNQSQDTKVRHWVTGLELPFFHKRKGVPKIDQSVKMPWHSVGVASSCSAAPDVGDRYDEETRSLAQRVEKRKQAGYTVSLLCSWINSPIFYKCVVHIIVIIRRRSRFALLGQNDEFRNVRSHSDLQENLRPNVDWSHRVLSVLFPESSTFEHLHLVGEVSKRLYRKARCNLVENSIQLANQSNIWLIWIL